MAKIYLNKQIERVCKFTSDDETRYQLKACHYSKDLKALVATDGHRAIFDKSSYAEYGIDFKSDVYLKTGELINFDYNGSKYPHVKMFYPDLSNYKISFDFQIPDYVKILSKYKKPVIGRFNAIGDLALTPIKDSIISLDLRLLAPINDNLVTVFIKDASSPIFIRLKDEPEVEIVVMPCRA